MSTRREGIPVAVALSCLLALVLDAPARGADPPDRDPQWLSDEAGVLELLLAHEERSGADVGVLRVDPTRRAVLWEGTGPQACPTRVEATFADVKAVRTRRGAGFVLELRGKPGRSLVLIPLPHGSWLTTQYAVAPRLERFLEGSETFPNLGPSRAAGSAGSGSAGAPVAVEPPPAVVADTRKAVERIREALGRAPTPAALVREVIDGRPVDLAVSELLEEAATYSGRAVRLWGHIAASATDPGAYRLRDGSSAVEVRPEREVAALLRAQLPPTASLEVEITGIVRPEPDAPVVSFWELSVLESASKEAAQGEPTTLRALASDPQARRSRTVRVIGKSRGGNMFGDLPPPSRRGASDWVIKDDRYAAWVTGEKPPGADSEPDGLSSAGAGYWVEVVGRPSVRDGVIYIQALSVRLISPPPGAHVLPPKQLAVGLDVAPAVVFTLPLEGERVPPDGRFVIQFSKYMDEGSLVGRVHLRHPGARQAGERDVPIRTRYEESHRALIVEPLEALDAGRAIEIRLLPGIVDVQGLALIARQGGELPAGAVDVIRYLVRR